jgi:DNA-binding NtrC family response regulator
MSFNQTSDFRGTLLALTLKRAQGVLQDAATAAGLDLTWTASLAELLERLRSQPWSATLLSFSVDPVDEGVAKRVGAEPNAGALLLSAPGASLERAILVEQAGAVALLHEPLQASAILARLIAVVEKGKVVPLPPAIEESGTGPVMVGTGPEMAEIFHVLARVASSPATVLVTGESGTGKELIAQAIHWASDRGDGPFVAVNCAAIPEHLLESELFGHERGAFTGAVARRSGRFERANGGTLFLDEIGDMSLVLQSKILRVLEERVLERVGGEETLPLDVRVVAATHQNLQQRIADGDFREDLYYRLAVVELHVPPLRERGDDTRELALHYVAHFADRYDRPMEGITEEAIQRLQAYHWPGNIRELRNVLDRAVLLSRGGVLRSSELRLGAASPRTSSRSDGGNISGYPPSISLDEVEADHIGRVLISVKGHMGNAAEILGIHRNTLARKVREFDIETGAEGG